MAFYPQFPAVVPAALKLQAATPVAGVALVNGTPAILTWTAPSDGAVHWVSAYSTLEVTVAQTGGAVNLAYTDPGGNANSAGLLPGGLGTGPSSGTAKLLPVQAGSTVTVTQTAQTLGTATLWAGIWAT